MAQKENLYLTVNLITANWNLLVNQESATIINENECSP